MTGNIQPFVLEQVAKADPDIQAIIAERIEAGEIFPAAKVRHPKGRHIKKLISHNRSGAVCLDRKVPRAF